MNESRSDNWIYHQILDKSPTKVYLSLGSNLGDREESLSQARQLIQEGHDNQVLKASSIYETEPVDCPKGELFLNQVLYVVTLLSPEKLLTQIQEIESTLGRSRDKKNEPRVIDIDILFYADQVIAEENLQVPHPRLHERRFVLEPLNEINPQIWHPVFEKPIQSLLGELQADHAVRLLDPVS